MNKEDNISDDQEEGLNGLSPKLSKIKDNNPFEADPDYFENFAGKLQHQIDELEEIKEEAPLLLAIPKYNPFEVPKGYFDELPTIIQQRCADVKPPLSIIEWVLCFVKPRFAIPIFATILLAIAAIYVMNKNGELPQIQFADEAAIEEQLYNIDETTIIDALTDDADNLKQNNTNECIENYLIDNNIDESNFENEL